MGPLGLTLLLLLGCGRPFHHATAIGDGSVELRVDAPRSQLRYPETARIRISIRNRGDKPFTLEWPPPFRVADGCTRGAQADAIEVRFRGNRLDRGFNATPYEWSWKPRTPSPARLVIEPGESRELADVMFEPPPGSHLITGGFCAVVYGYDLPGGVVYRGPER